MIEELKTILAREGITTAAIIDDVYDEYPTSKDIDLQSWNFFLDDQTDTEISIIRDEYGISDPESRWEELRNDDSFVRFLWGRRDRTPVLRALFQSFVEKLDSGKLQLEPLRSLLFDELKLQGGTFGSQQEDAGSASQLLFVDLFLGTPQDADARKKALERVKAIVGARRDSPPILVLVSSSQRLQAMKDEFRDDAELFGCQFRTLHKAELDDLAEVQELLCRATSSYQNSLRLSEFFELWSQALQGASSAFLKAVRRLDLRDYADFQELILKAEGELVGRYLLEAFGLYFQFQLEEDMRLAAAALKLNEVRWDNYPAPHFLPSAVCVDIADGMLFSSSRILSPSEPVQFGDLLLSTRVDALGEGVPPVANFAKGERIALVALTAACDLQHGNAQRVLFMTGVAKQSELIRHKRPKALLTPVLNHDGKHFTIEWESGAPVAWTLAEAQAHLQSGSFERVRRFRSLFALQLQQEFAGSLLRVGTPVMPPVQHVLGIVVSYVDNDGILKTIASATSAERKAVVLVGRDEKQHIDRLTLSEDLVTELRVAARKLDVNKVRERDRDKWALAIKGRQLYVSMERGISYKRDSFERSFKNSENDILTVVGPYAQKDNAIGADRKVKGDHGPLIIELDVPA